MVNPDYPSRVQPQTVDHLRDRLTHPKKTSFMCTPTRPPLTAAHPRGGIFHLWLATALLVSVAMSGCQEPPAPEVILGPSEPQQEQLTEQLDDLKQSAETTRALVKEASAKLNELDTRLTSGLRLREAVKAHQTLLLGALDAMPDEEERCAALGCPASRGVLESFEYIRAMGKAGWVKETMTASIDRTSRAVAVEATLTLSHSCIQRGPQANEALPEPCHPKVGTPVAQCLRARFERTQAGVNTQASPWTQVTCNGEPPTR